MISKKFGLYNRNMVKVLPEGLMRQRGYMRQHKSKGIWERRQPRRPITNAISKTEVYHQPQAVEEIMQTSLVGQCVRCNHIRGQANKNI